MRNWLKTIQLATAVLLAFTLAVPGAQAAETKEQPVKAKIKWDKDVAQQGKKATLQDGEPLKGWEKSNVEKAQSSLADASGAAGLLAPEAVDNHDPNHAIYLNLDTTYNDKITAQGMENWYYVFVPTAGKLTLVMQPVNNAAIDYDLAAWHLNQTTSSLENAVVSQYGPQINEQVAIVASEPGYYFFRVNSYQGFDAVNPFYIRATVSAGYDANEPNDNFLQATAKTGSFAVDGSIDNAYDLDWMSYSVPQDAKANIMLTNPGTGTYQFDIFDSSLQSLGTIPQNSSYYAILPAGNYYFRIRPESGTGSYHLNVKQQTVFDQQVSMATTPNGEDYNSVWSKIKAANPGVDFYGNVPLRSIYYKSTWINGVRQNYWMMEIKYTTSFYYDDIGYIVYNDQYKTFQLLDNGMWRAGFGADFQMALGIFTDDENYKKYDWVDAWEYHKHYIFDYYYNRDYTFEYHDLNADKPYFTSYATSNANRIIYGRAQWFSDGSGSATLTRIDRATGAAVSTSAVPFATNAEFESGTFESDNVYAVHSSRDGKTYRIDLNTLQVLSVQ